MLFLVQDVAAVQQIEYFDRKARAIHAKRLICFTLRSELIAALAVHRAWRDESDRRRARTRGSGRGVEAGVGAACGVAGQNLRTGQTLKRRARLQAHQGSGYTPKNFTCVWNGGRTSRSADRFVESWQSAAPSR